MKTCAVTQSTLPFVQFVRESTSSKIKFSQNRPEDQFNYTTKVHKKKRRGKWRTPGFFFFLYNFLFLFSKLG